MQGRFLFFALDGDGKQRRLWRQQKLTTFHPKCEESEVPDFYILAVTHSTAQETLAAPQPARLALLRRVRPGGALPWRASKRALRDQAYVRPSATAFVVFVHSISKFQKFAWDVVPRLPPSRAVPCWRPNWVECAPPFE